MRVSRVRMPSSRADLGCRIADAFPAGNGHDAFVAASVMFVQLKSGYGTDQGPCWISFVQFNRSWNTAYWHGKALRRRQRVWLDANFYDIETDEDYWLSGPHRDQRDTRYSGVMPIVDDDARAAYEAFLHGAPLPGRERG